MKCDKCGLEFSFKVWEIHRKICAFKTVEESEETVEAEEVEESVRAKAKELGIKSWHLKSIDKLQEEIEEVQ